MFPILLITSRQIACFRQFFPNEKKKRITPKDLHLIWIRYTYNHAQIKIFSKSIFSKYSKYFRMLKGVIIYKLGEILKQPNKSMAWYKSISILYTISYWV